MLKSGSSSSPGIFSILWLSSSVALVDISNIGGGLDQSFLPGSDTKGVGFIFLLTALMQTLPAPMVDGTEVFLAVNEMAEHQCWDPGGDPSLGSTCTPV